MVNAVRLNNLEHSDLCINNQASEEFGDNVTSTLTYPTEFIEVQREYPILFSKNPQTGEFQSVVLLGVQQNENLFLKQGKWYADYLPAVIAKGPFLIGFEAQDTYQGQVTTPVIYIDMASPRVSSAAIGLTKGLTKGIKNKAITSKSNINKRANDKQEKESRHQGERLFLDNGEQSHYLKGITRALATINDGVQQSKAMFDAFCRYDLIEAVKLEIELDNGEKINLKGNYTIHEEKLANLDGAALATLNNAGFLSLAFAVVASLANVRKLVALKNAAL